MTEPSHPSPELRPSTAPAFLHALDWLGPLLALIAIYAGFGFAIEGGIFFAAPTMRLIATQTVVVALAAMGMTFILIGAGIDLSVGSNIALSCVAAAFALDQGHPPAVAAAAAVLVGASCGLLNGLLVVGLRIVPFIVTLGTLGVFRGLSLMLAREGTINPPPTWLNRLMDKNPTPEWLLVSPCVWATVVLAFALMIVLRRTVFGVHVFAVGSSEETARLCGLRVGRIKIAVYTLGGFMAGLAGLMQYSYLGTGDSTTAAGYELDVIAAVVIGGGSLNGGTGSIPGTIIGALIMTTLRAGGSLMGWPNYVQMIIVGAIIVLAVALDRARRRES